MAHEKVARLFDGWAEAGRDGGMEREHGDVVQQVLERMDVAPGERILDLGCGNGWATRLLAQKNAGVQAIGVDCAPAMIERAEALHSLTIRARYEVGAFEELDFKDAHFDRLFSMEALYYAADLEKALQEAFRVLKPGGKADVVVDFHKDNPATEVWARAMGLPLHYKSAAEWRAAFERAGFGGVETRTLIDRRGPGDPAAFRPDECYPDWETRVARHEAGSLWIHAEKPR